MNKENKNRKQITKKQHFIPKFILKGWLNEDDEFYLNKLNYKGSKKIKFSKKNNKFSDDPFYLNYFYENDELEINEIEDELCWIEREFSNIIKQIDITKDKATFSRKQQVKIRFYLSIATLRTKALG